MIRQYDHFIGGQNYEPSSGRFMELKSPATDEPVARKASADGRKTGAEGFNAFTVLETLVINSGKRANIYSV